MRRLLDIRREELKNATPWPRAWDLWAKILVAMIVLFGAEIVFAETYWGHYNTPAGMGFIIDATVWTLMIVAISKPAHWLFLQLRELYRRLAHPMVPGAERRIVRR
ncbi:MAG TPA: hypothetical protein VE973_01795 [Candidatus Limnocylindria bacterium]|nr:hypothetical protein [Candidatus Limnocylindria bacterium]